MNERCPRCGSFTCVRRNKRTGTDFIGCSAYPNCKYTRPISNFDDEAWGKYVSKCVEEYNVK